MLNRSCNERFGTSTPRVRSLSILIDMIVLLILYEYTVYMIERADNAGAVE